LQNHVIAKERADKREGLGCGRCGKWALRKSAATLPKQETRGSGCEKNAPRFHGFEPPLISQSPKTMRQESMRIHSRKFAAHAMNHDLVLLQVLELSCMKTRLPITELISRRRSCKAIH
jgi:hypothetical protein